MVKKIIIALILILLVAGATVNFWINTGTKKYILSELNKNPERLYDIAFDRLEIDWIKREVKMLDASVQPTKRVTEEEGKLDFTVKEVLVSEVAIMPLVLKKSFTAGKISVQTPSIKFRAASELESREEGQKSRKELNSSLRDVIFRINIRGFSIKDADFSIQRNDGRTRDMLGMRAAV